MRYFIIAELAIKLQALMDLFIELSTLRDFKKILEVLCLALIKVSNGGQTKVTVELGMGLNTLVETPISNDR